MIPATEALNRLREGNRRYVEGSRRLDTPITQARRDELLAGQEPFAVILGCSDSRVPVEVVFDQGLGDLFVVRVAGNVAAPPEVGSVEFAAGKLGTRLVAVLGHTHCGAVTATVDASRGPDTGLSPGLRSIVDRIRPAVEGLPDTASRDELIRQGVRANVRVAADQLRHGSALLERLIGDEGLLVVGAEYCLETGEVDFFDGVPGSA
ncbi:MAG TPA: carbonic anhydrase [Gammaproteobacteria bacterium]|nr:carbonic anhydrase [Gammaproteobacteria bacterium]